MPKRNRSASGRWSSSSLGAFRRVTDGLACALVIIDDRAAPRHAAVYRLYTLLYGALPAESLVSGSRIEALFTVVTQQVSSSPNMTDFSKHLVKFLTLAAL